MKKELVVGIVCVLIAASISSIAFDEKNKNISYSVSREIVSIGCMKKDAKAIDINFNARFLQNTPITGWGDDKYPSICDNAAGNFLLEYSITTSAIDIDLGIAYSLDNGKTWSVFGPIDVFEGEAEMQTAIDFCRTEDGKSLAYGTFITTANDGGITPFIVFEDMKDETTWTIYYLDWSDDDFYGLESIDIACDDEIEGMDEDFVMTYTMSFPAFDNWPEVHQIPFILFHPEGDSYWCYWFYYNWSAHARIDIDRAKDMIYLTFDTKNETNRDVILEFAPESALGEWGDGKGEIGLLKVGGNANAINPDVDADNGYVYLVCQVDTAGNQDIVCFYSSDGGETWEMSTIANSQDDELYPVIEATGSKATCIFSKNGNLYAAISEDGGKTWKTVGPINEIEGSVEEEYANYDISSSHVVWADKRGDDLDIYFDKAAAVPVLDVQLSGGFGIKVTISNVGTGVAKDLKLTVDMSGIVLIGKHGEKAIDEIKPGESVTFNIFVIGIGPATININVDGASKEASAFIIGPIVLMSL